MVLLLNYASIESYCIRVRRPCGWLVGSIVGRAQHAVAAAKEVFDCGNLLSRFCFHLNLFYCSPVVVIGLCYYNYCGGISMSAKCSYCVQPTAAMTCTFAPFSYYYYFFFVLVFLFCFGTFIVQWFLKCFVCALA